ncbi:hypothetical protein AB0R12_31620 [Streptomyces niveus]|uniref:hypothetical protein n=1 Tax=Streptomyces niveus TaxID=193462 RepID=UPI003435E0E0
MRRRAAAFEPGEVVPQSGLYVCDCGGQHLHWGTDVRGHRFPALPSGCTGHAWGLRKSLYRPG